MFRNILKLSIITNKNHFTSLPLRNMEVTIKKPKYDGRSKKRQWQERRTDKGLNEESNEKISKLDESETVPFVRIKRRKYAMLLGYNGADYYGMQRNPGTKTIEEDLLNALFKTNHISEQDYQIVQNMQFQRAARTDKGVSAVRQILSLKLPETVNVEAINKELPNMIRVFGIKKVTKGFNSKSNCDARTYSYTLPTVALAHKNMVVEQNGFRLDNETFHKVNHILNLFVGTKNFHNFTSKKSANDPSANRHIKSFYCDRPFVRNDVEFAVLKIKGQSFMLHQIRKMVALMLSVVRGHADESIFQQALSTDKINVPRAPGLGLLLEFVHYDRYDFRYGEDGIHEKLTWVEYEEDVEKFKDEYILPAITTKEIQEKEMVIWLSKLKGHRFDDLDDKVEDDDEKSDEECLAENS